jgi:hypothetical protein
VPSHVTTIIPSVDDRAKGEHRMIDMVDHAKKLWMPIVSYYLNCARYSRSNRAKCPVVIVQTLWNESPIRQIIPPNSPYPPHRLNDSGWVSQYGT